MTHKVCRKFALSRGWSGDMAPAGKVDKRWGVPFLSGQVIEVQITDVTTTSSYLIRWPQQSGRRLQQVQKLYHTLNPPCLFQLGDSAGNRARSQIASHRHFLVCQLFLQLQCLKTTGLEGLYDESPWQLEAGTTDHNWPDLVCVILKLMNGCGRQECFHNQNPEEKQLNPFQSWTWQMLEPSRSFLSVRGAVI